MADEEQSEMLDETANVPKEFFCVNIHGFLSVVSLTMLWCIFIARAGQAYINYILWPFTILVCIIDVIYRRRLRAYVRKHGEVRIITTFSPEKDRPVRSVWFREVGEIVDQAIDRVLDGKEKNDP